MSRRFAKEDAWRKHPSLQVGVRNMLPGFGRAVKIFAVYVVLEKAYDLYKTPISGVTIDLNSVRWVRTEIGKPPALERSEHHHHH